MVTKIGMRATLSLILLLAVLVAGCALLYHNFFSSEARTAREEARQAAKMDAKAEDILSGMSLEEKIGQMIIASIPGPVLDDASAAFLSDYHIGNVILFANNIADRQQLTLLNAQIQKTITSGTRVPALIGLDQEGGKITRILNGATIFPGSMAVAAAGDPKNAFLVGKYMGQELKALGFSINFAPVLDVNSNPDNPVINVRSYSDNPQTAAAYGVSMTAGLQAGGLLACGKHFPGHGDTSIDSHYGLPVVEKTKEQLWDTELYPFRQAIGGAPDIGTDDPRSAADGADGSEGGRGRGIDAIMTSHILFPAFDPSGTPATMSRPIVTGLLREEMHFDGLIISDGMQMNAIQEWFGMTAGCIAAVNAGVDLLITGTGGTPPADAPNVQAAAVQGLADAVRGGTIPVSRIDQAAKRILICKMKAGLFGNSLPSRDVLTADWSMHAQFSRQLAQKSITLVKDTHKLLPIAPSQRLLFISHRSSIPLNMETAADPVNLANLPNQATQGRLPTDAFSQPPPDSFAALAAQKFGGDSLLVYANPTKKEIRQAAAIAAGYDRIVVASSNSKYNTGQSELINSLWAANPNTIVVSLGMPYDLYQFPQVGTYLCGYEYTPNTVASVLAVLAGEQPATGTLPVALNY